MSSSDPRAGSPGLDEGFLRQFVDLFETRERVQLAVLLLVMLAVALVDTIGVASILPFMEVVANPDVIRSNPWLERAYDVGGFETAEGFLLFSGGILLGLIGLRNLGGALTTWMTQRFAWGQNHRLSMRLLRRYLGQEYSFFLGRNTAGLHRTLLGEVEIVTQGVLLSVLHIVSRVPTMLLILGVLIAVDPLMTLGLATGLGGAYAAVFFSIRRRQRRLGRARVRANERRFAVAAEGLQGIKTVKSLGREDEFLRRFAIPSSSFASATASNRVVGPLPSYLLETLAFGGILVILLYQISAGNAVAELLPVLSLYAFAAYRLFPGMNQLFQNVVKLHFNRAALEELWTDLQLPAASTERQQFGAPELEFRDSISLERLSFRYSPEGDDVLHELTLRIPKNHSVAFVGSTGAGKTTLIDIVLGLLEPTAGELCVDGHPIRSASVRWWRRQCGYVPQDIFLSDDTIRANIAFGLPEEEIDDESVERAARMAQIHEFVTGLPRSYRTVVGERGVRLSGGQRQRIGIARALYGNPQVLVLDEATSSLDGGTERSVVDTIRSLSSHVTLLVVAHRLSTVEHCETVCLLEGGRIVAKGAFRDLARDNASFRAMAALDPVEAGVIGG